MSAPEAAAEDGTQALLAADRDISGRVAPLDLYYRWESQHWQISSLTIAQDRPDWAALPGFLREELLHTVFRFAAGELAVTQTLAPIAHAAPTEDYQIYLSTQIADEARHALFFRTYVDSLRAVGIAPSVIDREGDETVSVGDLFEQSLRTITDQVRADPDDLARWYEAIVVYHLLIEGTVAMTGLHSLLRTIREHGGFAALREGLTNVARDESRHVNFGVLALRDGIRAGHRELIVHAVRRHVPAAAFTMVAPEYRDTTPRLVQSLTDRPRRIGEQWQFAIASLDKRLTATGLEPETVRSLVNSFRQGCVDAVARYRELHGVDHPVRVESMDADPLVAEVAL
ncbi:ribonucleotide-diphosphate reductase subunit beta [Nocardia brasiliensis]|uniref:ribonucleotide-diphosphate reductase subunit beta n=1 Tax=Nocardia brasiliensis TaxID=37326 RepID=UPI00366D43F4